MADRCPVGAASPLNIMSKAFKDFMARAQKQAQSALELCFEDDDDGNGDKEIMFDVDGNDCIYDDTTTAFGIEENVSISDEEIGGSGDQNRQCKKKRKLFKGQDKEESAWRIAFLTDERRQEMIEDADCRTAI